MNKTERLALLPVLALLAGGAVAQDQGKKPTKATGHALQGAKVELAFEEAPMGPEAKIQNAEGTVLGTVRDHVVAPGAGKLAKVTHVVLATGSRDVLVPYGRFRWNGETRQLVLPVEADELSKMKDFDAASFRGKTRDAAAGAPIGSDLLASELVGARFLAGEEPAGEVATLVLEPNAGSIAFALVAPREGGEHLVVPWAALIPRPSQEDPETIAVQVKKTELDGAPTIAPDQIRKLEQREMLDRIYAYYEVQTPFPMQKDA